jgi:hypothetical protein
MNQKFLGRGYLICNLYDHNYLEFFTGTEKEAIDFIKTMEQKAGEFLAIKGHSIPYYMPEEREREIE